jgi:hypothetical protein
MDMKYVKEYNQFGDDSLYEPISYEQYIEFFSSNCPFGKPLPYTSREVDLIKSVITKDDRFRLIKNGPLSKNPNGEFIFIDVGYFIEKFGERTQYKINIAKYSDEWFIANIEIPNRSYRDTYQYSKCDTIDGVIQLIRDTSSSLIKESTDNSDDWYHKVDSYSVVHNINFTYFENINSRILEMVKYNLSAYIRDNCPRISIRTDIDGFSGNEFIVIDGFDYWKSGHNPKWHKHNEIKFLRRVMISQLRDEWFLVRLTVSSKHIWFKCDQIDGLMKLLEDYYICDKLIKESVGDGILAKKISIPERIKFQDSHSLISPDESDCKVIFKYYCNED